MRKEKNILHVLFLTLLVDMIGVGMVIPVLPALFTDVHASTFLLAGYSEYMRYIVVGAVTALFGIMQFIAAPILGELSDYYGRKKLLTLTVSILAIAQALFGIGIAIASLPLLLASRAAAGLAGANFSIAQAAIADVTLPADRARSFGLIGAAFGVGFIIGPVVGGWLATITNNAAIPFFCASAMGILNAFSVFFLLPETRKTAIRERKSFTIFKGVHNIRAAWHDHAAREIYLASFFYGAGFAFFTAFVSILLVERFGMSEAKIGSFFGVVGIWVVITQMGIVPAVSRRYTERAVLRITLPFLACAIAAYPFIPSAWMIFLLVPCISIPNGLSMAHMGALISKSVSADRQGAAMGINSSLMALAQGTVPLVAAAGAGVIGIAAPFIVGAASIIYARTRIQK